MYSPSKTAYRRCYSTYTGRGVEGLVVEYALTMTRKLEGGFDCDAISYQHTGLLPTLTYGLLRPGVLPAFDVEVDVTSGCPALAIT
jgi:hypothetical protein